MKKLVLIFLLSSVIGHLTTYSQSTNTIYGDTVKLTTRGPAGSILVLQNATKDTIGFLYNTGNGVTMFKRAAVKKDDSTWIVGADTMIIKTPQALLDAINVRVSYSDSGTAFLTPSGAASVYQPLLGYVPLSPGDSTIKYATPTSVAAAISNKVGYPDSTIKYATPTSVAAAISNKVGYPDSTIKYATPTSVAAAISNKVGYPDSTIKYATPTSVAAAISNKVGYPDSTIKYATPTSVAAAIRNKVNYTDTAAMLSHYLTTAIVSGKINYSDTITKVVTPTQGDGRYLRNADTLIPFTAYGITVKKLPTYVNADDIYKNLAAGKAVYVGLARNTTGTVTLPAQIDYCNWIITRGDAGEYQTPVDDLVAWRDSFMILQAGKKTYYFAERGSDANTGLTQKDPVRSPRTALAKSDCGTAVGLGGVFGNNEMPNGSQSGAYNLISLGNCHYGAFVTMGGWFADATYPNALVDCKNTNSANITGVYDRNSVCDDNTFQEFAYVTTLDSCAKMPYSYFISNDTLFCNYSILPSADYNTLLTSIDGRIELSVGSSSYNLYVEGGYWYNTVETRSQGLAQANPKCYLRDMYITKSSGTYDVYKDLGYDPTEYNVCIKKTGSEDAFNYHKWGSGPRIRAIEIKNRVLFKNERFKPASSDQASTTHDTSMIMRFNCYYKACGTSAIIHDILQAVSCNYGCKFWASPGALASYQISDNLSLGVLENCNVGGGSTYSIYVDNGATLQLNGTSFNSINVTGTGSNVKANN